MITNKSVVVSVLVLTLLVAVSGGAVPKVEFAEHANRIDVMVAGKLFTSYVHAIDPAKPMFRQGCVLTKPILFPVYSPSGVMVTRGYPLMDIPGEAQDHPHHMGVYFTVDINEERFWGNSSKPLPKIEHKKVTETKSGVGSGTLATVAHWVGSDGKPMLEETRQMVFIADKKGQYAIDFTIYLKALDKKVVFGDTKEGMMAIRVAPWLKEDGGSGKYLSSEGKETEKNVWGRRAKWMLLHGQKDGKTYGVAILNHPDSVNYPTFWHARGYGCFTANPLGQGAFEKSHKIKDASNLNLTLEPGQSACFKHRMVIYEDLRTAEQIEAQFSDYTQPGGNSSIPRISTTRP